MKESITVQEDHRVKDLLGLDSGLSAEDAQLAARGCLAKFDRTRTALIHIADLLFRPLIRALNLLRASEPSADINKILVVESGQLGDIVLLSPFLRNLRIHQPNASLSLAARSKVFPLLEGQGLVDKFIPLDVPWGSDRSHWLRYNPLSSAWVEFARSVSSVRREKFDVAFCAKGDFRDNFLIWLTRAKRRIGYGFYGGSFFLTDPVVPDLDRPHYSRRWLHLLEHFGVRISGAKPHLELSLSEREFARQYLAEKGVRPGETVIGIHPGARLQTRQWGIDNFLAVGTELASHFPIRILWFQDPHATSADHLPEKFIRVSFPLRQFMALLAHCNFLICNESGPMHIATALGLPVVTVLGPTPREWFGPLGDRNAVVLRNGFWCRPCGDRCIFDQPYCLRTISRERVLMEARALILTAINNGCATTSTK